MTEQSINLSVDLIQADTRAQSRAEIDMVVVGEYSDDMRSGAIFPPLVVFYDQSTYWLSEGFHRYHAYKQSGITTVKVVIKDGGLRDAILQSLGSNVDHGKRRTNADKRRAVELMLKDSEWGKWSNSEIARQCRVDEKTVRNSRESIFGKSEDTPRTATRNGTTYTINTGNIGKKAEPAPVVVAPEPEYEDLPFEDEFEDEVGAPVSIQSMEPDDGEDAFLEELEADTEAPPASAFNDVVHDPVIDISLTIPAIPVPNPPVSTADPRQLGYIGTATPVSERDSNDWHTPAKYIELVRSVMGRIDFDPFSSEVANKTVKATKFFTIEDDAIYRDGVWATGPIKVFCNPPYGRGVIDSAIERFLNELDGFQEAIVLVNNATETQWFQQLLNCCKAVCFPDHRIAFVSPDNKQESGNTRGQTFFYFGENYMRFIEVFVSIGGCSSWNQQ